MCKAKEKNRAVIGRGWRRWSTWNNMHEWNTRTTLYTSNTMTLNILTTLHVNKVISRHTTLTRPTMK